MPVHEYEPWVLRTPSDEEAGEGMKVPKTLGLSEELWDEIEERRGRMNRSAFVEMCLLELFKAQDELRRREAGA